MFYGFDSSPEAWAQNWLGEASPESCLKVDNFASKFCEVLMKSKLPPSVPGGRIFQLGLARNMEHTENDTLSLNLHY